MSLVGFHFDPLLSLIATIAISTSLNLDIQLSVVPTFASISQSTYSSITWE